MGLMPRRRDRRALDDRATLGDVRDVLLNDEEFMNALANKVVNRLAVAKAREDHARDRPRAGWGN